MNQYTIVSFENDRIGTSCEHCGRGIKNIAILKDNVTGNKIKVGLTCFGKIMKLNETFEKAVQKAVKKYKKDIEHYKKDMNIVEEFKKRVEWNKEYEVGHYCYKTDKEILRDAIQRVSFGLTQMIIKTKELNKLSKQGLIQLEDLEQLEKQLAEHKNRFKSVSVGRDWEYDLSNEKELLSLIN